VLLTQGEGLKRINTTIYKIVNVWYLTVNLKFIWKLD
jgi:hypothetical protein